MREAGWIKRCARSPVYRALLIPNAHLVTHVNSLVLYDFS